MWKDTNVLRNVKTQKTIPKIRVAPDFKESWFDPPTPESTSDSIGYWDKSTSYPKNTPGTDWVPKNNTRKIPKVLKHLFDSENLEKFIDGKKWGETANSNKVPLPTSVFEPNHFSFSNHHIGPNIDKMTRGCLKENLITDEMLGLQDLSIERLIEYVTNVGPDDSKEELMKSVIEELEFFKKRQHSCCARQS